MRTSTYLIIISLIVGLLSGIIGSVWSNLYLSHYSESLESIFENSLLLSEQKPRPLPETFDEALDMARESFSGTVVHFYPHLSTLVPGDEVALGILITSDGWVLVDGSSFTSGIWPLAYVGTTAYEIKDVQEDELTGLSLVKLEASGMPVIAFGSSKLIESGDIVFMAAPGSGVASGSIIDSRAWLAGHEKTKAEEIVRGFSYSAYFEYSNVPVLNTSGELVAVGEIPLESIIPVIRSVIRSGEISRSTFGAVIIDLYATRVSESISRGFDRGVYIDSVTYGQPAAAAGLKRGDIILKAGETTLNGHQTFSEWLLDYAPGDSITLTIDRGGEEMTIEVKLD